MNSSRKSVSVARVVGILVLLLTVGVLVVGTKTSITKAQPQSALSLSVSPLSGGVLAAKALHSGAIQPLGNAAPGFSNADALTCSPAPCVLPTSQASEGGSPVNEDPIAAAPGTTNVLLSGGNDYNCATLQGFFVSVDTGSTWNHTCMTLAPGLSSGAGDPGVAFSANGKTAYISGLDFTNTGGIDVVFEKSTNNGSTWSTAKVAVTPLFASGQTDKDWLQIDTSRTSPHINCLYISTTQFDPSSNSAIAVAHSCDGGTTWTNVQVDTKQIYPSNVDQFSDLAIGKDGTVYVSWMRCPATGPTGDCGSTAASMMFSKSTDGGSTWSAAVKTASAALAPDSCGAFYGCIPNTFERVSNIPAIDIDNSTGAHAGSLYVVMYNYNSTAKQMQVQTVKSTNGGSTWSTPTRVAPTGTHDEFFPWLSVNGNGWVGISWLDRRNDPANVSYQSFAAVSHNGGSSYGPSQQLTTALSNPSNDGFGGGFMGDYTGNIWVGRTLFASWMDTSNGSDSQDTVGGFVD